MLTFQKVSILIVLLICFSSLLINLYLGGNCQYNRPANRDTTANNYNKDDNQLPPNRAKISVGGEVEHEEPLFRSVSKAFNISSDKVIVVGIPFVFRPLGAGAMYLIDTLTNLLSPLTPKQRTQIQIILLNTDMNLLRHNHLFYYLMKHFPKELEEGTLVAYSMTTSEYHQTLISDPCSLRGFEGDSLLRTRWTSKLVWDTRTLMKIASTRGKYYLHLEDDTPPKQADWYQSVLDTAETQNDINKDWWMLIMNGHRFSRRMGGMFGLLFKTEKLPPLVEFLEDRFDLMPIDWLLGEYGYSKSIEKSVYSAYEIFMHQGKTEDSTKIGVDQKMKAAQFDELVSWEQCIKKKRKDQRSISGYN